MGAATTPVYDRFGVAVYHGECLDVMAGMPDASVRAIVTDPPYGLEFMGADWDTFTPGGKRPGFGKPDGSKFRQNMGTPSWGANGNPTCRNCSGDKYRHGPRKCACGQPEFPNHMVSHMRAFQAWCEQWARECLRVLKPGGHLVAFGGTRTYHRLTVGLEDAGFEIRDSIAWLYGSGFPKSLDVSKAIDRAPGAARQVYPDPQWTTRYLSGNGGSQSPLLQQAPHVSDGPLTTSDPVTDAARQWEGWGTALKPGHEPIVVARKPLSSTVVATVLEHGTGALNIDGCRVPTSATDATAMERANSPSSGRMKAGGSPIGTFVRSNATGAMDTTQGRWPPNTVLTHAALVDPAIGEVLGDACAEGCVNGCVVAELDRQSGDLTSGLYLPRHADNGKTIGTFGAMAGRERSAATYGDTGGASRFFPCFRWEAKAPASERPRVAGKAWPTVKPVGLIRWLVRLVTPPSGTVLDLFAGTGTTGQAARAEGFPAILIEQDADAIGLIRARLDARPKTDTPTARQPPDEAPLDLLDLIDGAAS